jgi:hypothetical protein
MVVSRYNTSTATPQHSLWTGVAGALFGALIVALALKVGFEPAPDVSTMAVKIVILPLVVLMGLKVGVWGFKVARSEARLTTHMPIRTRRERRPATHEVDMKLLLLSNYSEAVKSIQAKKANPNRVQHPGNEWYH